MKCDISKLSEYFNIKNYWEITIPLEGSKTKKLSYLVEAETEEEAKARFLHAPHPTDQILSVKRSKITHVVNRDIYAEGGAVSWYKVTLHIEDYNYNDANVTMAAALLVYLINARDMIEPLQSIRDLHNKENVYIDFLEATLTKYEDFI